MEAETENCGKRELRKAKRYPLRVPVTFCWDRGDGVLQESQGTTVDMSSRGVFVVAEVLPPAGVYLELEAYLPSARGNLNLVQLHGEGKVLRANRKGSESGFAAEAVFQTACLNAEGLIE